MATSEGIPSSIDIEFLELNDNPYIIILIHSAKVLLLDNHVSFGNIVFGLASARPTPQGLSGAPKNPYGVIYKTPYPFF